MALIPYALARPFLFSLDPETAHDLTLDTLARTQGTILACGYARARISDPVQVAGLHFPNRVGLAAGLDKNARCIDALGAMGFGFLEVGTVTPLAQDGNPKPRMFRLPAARALINRLGFNNQGLEAFIRHVKSSRHYQLTQPEAQTGARMLLGLNIGKNAITPIERATEDYLTCLRGVYPYADYVTVNISSPNTKNLRSLQSEQALDQLLQAVSLERERLAQQHGKQIPVFLKIAPDLDDDQIASISHILQRYGAGNNGEPNNAWGVIATNTTLSRSGVEDQAAAQESGGLSGAPLLAQSNRVIAALRQALGPRFPIIGVGGILSAQDAVAKIKAGADLVQIYTGLIYGGPELVPQAAQAIRQAR